MSQTLRSFVHLYLYLLIVILCYDPLISTIIKNDDNKRIEVIKPLRVAYCLTGQVSRLELISKVRNIFIPNAILNHSVDVFTLLDGNTSDIKQTFWRFNYSNNIYTRFNASTMTKFIQYQVHDALIETPQAYAIANIRIRPVRFDELAQHHFSIRGSKIPVTDKSGPKKDPFASSQGIEPASQRFQNNMRWMSAVRECVKWVQKVEVDERMFFDLIVRLRDDSYAFRPWLIDSSVYLGGITSSRIGMHFGFNDHNFVVDRQFADNLLRGITEDYYFNQTLDNFIWVNPEHRIFKLASSLGISILNMPMCEHPLIPLRGLYNKTHWRLHVQYCEHYLDECLGETYVNMKVQGNSKPQSIPDVVLHGRSRVGIRRVKTKNPYTLELLLKLVRRHRDILHQAMSGKLVHEQEAYCCNDALVKTLKAQVIRVESVYDLMRK